MFFSWSVFGGSGGQESHLCSRAGPHCSFLCPKPRPLQWGGGVGGMVRAVLTAPLLPSASLSSPQHFLPRCLPWARLARKPSPSRGSQLSIFKALALLPKRGLSHMMTSRAGLRLGATSQGDHLLTFHFGLELCWISLSQMPSSVCSSPSLLCVSLLNTDDKMTDETRVLVTLVPGNTRCR